jgi:hypothetical protein
VKDGHKADFYYRIIPEVLGSGLNCETVDVCGGMASLCRELSVTGVHSCNN